MTPRDLLPLVYDELRKLAQAKMLYEDAGHTLDATALVHEVWLKRSGPSWQGFSGKQKATRNLK